MKPWSFFSILIGGKNNEEERVGTEFAPTEAYYITWTVKPTFLFPLLSKLKKAFHS